MNKPVKPATLWQKIFHNCDDHMIESGNKFIGGYMNGYLIVLQSFKCNVCGNEKTKDVSIK